MNLLRLAAKYVTLSMSSAPPLLAEFCIKLQLSTVIYASSLALTIAQPNSYASLLEATLLKRFNVALITTATPRLPCTGRMVLKSAVIYSHCNRFADKQSSTIAESRITLTCIVCCQFGVTNCDSIL